MKKKILFFLLLATSVAPALTDLPSCPNASVIGDTDLTYDYQAGGTHDYNVTALQWKTYCQTGVVLTGGSYSNPSWLTALAWGKLTGLPTTLSGYGITDSIVVTGGSYTNPSWIVSLPWSKITATPTTLGGYGITDALAASNDLSDLTSVSTARTHLGLGPLAILSPTGTASSSTFLRGDDSWSALPVASSSVLGAVKIPTWWWTSLTVDGSGNLTANIATTTTTGVVTIPAGGLSVDGSGNVTLNDATDTTLGGVIVPDASGLTVDGSGNITLDLATTSALGGVIVPMTGGLSVDGSANISFTPLVTINTTATATFNTACSDETIANTSSSTLSAVTITLPTTARQGQMLRYATKVVSTVTMAGQTVDGWTAPGSTSAGGCIAFQCESTNGHFVRIQ